MADAALHAARFPDARTRVLDAAESVILARGVPALTLEATARFAGVSKGGLLHHFATKEALLRALVERIAGELDADWERALATASADRRPATRAALAWAFHGAAEAEARMMRRGAVLLAAHHHDPALLGPIRAFHARIRAAVEADAPRPGIGLAIIAACDGLFAAHLFGTWQPAPEEAGAIEAALAGLIGAAP